MKAAVKKEATVTVDGPRVVVGRLQPQVERRPRQASKPKERTQGPSLAALMLALAYRIERAIDEGEVRDQAEAARRLGVTRMSQILDLFLLSSWMQESLLGDPSVIGAETRRRLR